MRNNSIVIFIIMLLTATSYCIEISAPIKWRADGYIARLVPRTEKYFMDGMMDASIDMIRFDISNNFNINFFLRSTIWTGMGYQYEDIIFDPRYMHYSLVPGLKNDFKIRNSKYSLMFQWFHDCFHEVDRKEEPTIIWNIFELRLSPRNYFPDVRRKLFLHNKSNAIRFRPKIFWDFAIGIFPRFHDPVWFQYTHPLNNRIDANLQISLLEYKSLHCEIAYNPTLYFQNGGETSQRQYVELAVKQYGTGGTFSLFWGYTVRETQPVRPINNRVWLGARWEL